MEGLLAFLKNQGWTYDYDKWNNAYLTGIVVDQKDGHILHSVTVKIAMTLEGKVKDIVVGDAYKP